MTGHCATCWEYSGEGLNGPGRLQETLDPDVHATHRRNPAPFWMLPERLFGSTAAAEAKRRGRPSQPRPSSLHTRGEHHSRAPWSAAGQRPERAQARPPGTSTGRGRTRTGPWHCYLGTWSAQAAAQASLRALVSQADAQSPHCLPRYATWGVTLPLAQEPRAVHGDALT